jgi:hypothetical protein
MRAFGVVAVLCAVPATVTLVAAPPGAGLPLSGEEALETTAQAIRLAGFAMLSWVSNQPDEIPRRPEMPPRAPTRIDWRDCPPLDPEDAVGLIEPEYLPRLPRLDGWGRPLEYCLSRTDVTVERGLVGVRSAGPDGVFQGPAYRRRPFPHTDPRGDLVWFDGWFITWPEGWE